MTHTREALNKYDAIANKAVAKGYSEDRAHKIAQKGIDEQYRQETNGEYVLRSSLYASINSYEQLVMRSNGLQESVYIVEGYVATTNVDDKGQRISPNVIKNIASELSGEYVSLKGNINHDTIKYTTHPKTGRIMENPSFKEEADIVGKVISARVDQNGLHIKTMLNPLSKRFQALWNDIKSGFFDGFSIELGVLDTVKKMFRGKEIEEITDARARGFAFTEKPSDRTSRITASYIQ